MSELLALVMAEVITKVKPKAPPLVVSDQEIDTLLTTDPKTQQTVLATAMDRHLAPLRDMLLSPLPDGHGFTQAALDKLQSAHGSLPMTPVEANRLPGSDFDHHDSRLRFFGRVNHKTKQWRFFYDIAAAAARLASHTTARGVWDHPTSLSAARAQYKACFALKAFYCRVAAASSASRETNTSLAEALALYMSEGEMVVPMPMSDVDFRLPPMDEGFDFYYSAEEGKPNEDKPDLASTMVCGLWSKDLDRFRKAWGIPGKNVFDPSLEICARLDALLDWHLIVIGYDYLTKRVVERARARTKQGQGNDRQNVLEELGLFLIDIGMANTPEIAAKTILDLFGSLALHVTKTRVIVAPKDPVSLLSFLLKSGLRFMKLAGSEKVEGPSMAVPASLSYLAHNTSDTRHKTDPVHDKFIWIMASAAVALSRKTSAPVYCAAAHSAIRGLGPLKELPNNKPYAKTGWEKHAALGAQVVAVLNTPELRDEFAAFIIQASAVEWGGWTKHRANLARYLRILRWYETITA